MFRSEFEHSLVVKMMLVIQDMYDECVNNVIWGAKEGIIFRPRE